ncbi:MAG: sugar phosphate isomerase/epimerase [Clostridia bacterium]|nr:sugar phosphate isomerase/epimerase [Clostridia bacterium]
MGYGLQLFSVRDITKDDLQGALKKVAELGYESVEFAGFFGHTPEEVTGWLKEYGLKVGGTHTGMKEIDGDFEGTLAYHKAIGNKNIIVPWAELKTKAQVDELIDQLNKYEPLLRKEGIALGYHNHDFEFKPNEDGVVPYDEIVARTHIDLEIDTFWVYAAGKNPVELMEQLKDRVHLIHIKDGLANGDGFPLGKGTAPVADVYRKAKELGIQMVVESETLTPDGITEAQICIDYLKAQE